MNNFNVTIVKQLHKKATDEELKLMRRGAFG